MTCLGAGLASILAQSSAVHRPGLLGVLIVLALVVYLCDLSPLPSWQIDAGLGVALVALVFCGPLAAFVVFASPEPLRRIVERDLPSQPRWIATVANNASFAVGVALAYLVLVGIRHPDGPLDAWPVYAAAAAGLLAGNVGIAHFVMGRLVSRVSWTHAVRVYGALLPLAFLAAGVVSLESVIGLPALALFATIACLPGVLIRFITPVLAPRAAQLTREQATVRYVRALAIELQLPRAARRGLVIAAGSPPRWPSLSAKLTWRERHEAGRICFESAAAERLHDDRRLSRDAAVLAFARAWAELTAAGSLEMSQTAALLCLESDPDHHPRQVLQAAWCVVDAQPALGRDRGWTPVSRPLARRLAALAATQS